jgi:uncharacterized protein (TIGR03032 family)
VVAAPQSGAGYVRQALAQLPGVRSLEPGDRAIFERARELDPETPDANGHRRTAADADPQTAERIRLELTMGRGGGDPDRRIVDAAPRHALRIPFLDAIFPDASFVFVYRDPRETIASIVEAWQSGNHVTYPSLPGWPGPPWSLLLVPGWRELAGADVVEIAAAQWETTTRIVLGDLDQLSPERWSVIDFAAIAANPEGVLTRLADFLGLETAGTAFPDDPGSHLATPSAQGHEATAERLEAILPRSIGVAERARDLIATPVSRRPTTTPDAESPLRSAYTGGFRELLDELGGSLLATSHDAQKLVCIRGHGPRVNTHFRTLSGPRAVVAQSGGFAVAGGSDVWRYRDVPERLPRLDPARPYDACLVPQVQHLTDEFGVRDLGDGGGRLWLASTEFSCLVTLDDEDGMVERWRPRFISALVAEDRCHLNGVAIAEGRPAFATALGVSDTPGGWRRPGPAAGCAIDVASSEVVASGLCLPHSPRWHDGQLWICEGGEGVLCTLDVSDGSKEVVVQVPGFARGLAFAASTAFIGVSRPRTSGLGGLPVSERFAEMSCGIWAVDTASGTIRGYLRFEAEMREISSLAFLPGLRFPEVADPGEVARLPVRGLRSRS